MQRLPRSNLFIFLIYLALSFVVCLAAFLVPQFRDIRIASYAPLRELVLPPPEPVIVSVLYSTEKEGWLDEATASFQSMRPTVGGRPIQLTLEKMGSREMYLAVLEGTKQPDLFSPASSLQVSILSDLSRNKFGKSIVDLENCRSVFETPLVLVAWEERAEVLWGDEIDGRMWWRLYEALTGPSGWEAYGHPEWSYIKFGHTDPLKSNSGFMTILLMTYNYFDKTSGLTAEDILSNEEYREWFAVFENTISDFGDSTGTYMKEMVAYGPSTYDIVAVYESTAIEHAESAEGRYGALRVYYPPATVLSDHPFCVLEADWVTPEKSEAAQQFVDYLLSEPVQELALKYGFRPADGAVSLEQAGSPFERYRDIGFHIALPPEVEVPPGNVLNTLLDFWSRTVRR